MKTNKQLTNFGIGRGRNELSGDSKAGFYTIFKKHAICASITYWSCYVRYENVIKDESGRGPVDRHPAGNDQLMTGRSVADI